MEGRRFLAEADVDFDPDTVEIDDGDVLDLLEPAVREWWVEQFGAFVPENGGFFTPPQKEAIPHIHEGRNALVAAPTGSGKTLSAFTAIINELFRRDRHLEGDWATSAAADHPSEKTEADHPPEMAETDHPPETTVADHPPETTVADEPSGLENSVYCLYVSPLKSLANDIHRNLEVPLDGITEKLGDRGEDVEIRHAIRHGDTPDAERQAMLEETPHILNTTPETLAILLNSPKFREKLRTVEYVVVDEIHSLAENKRGTHLSVSLERLEHLADGSPTRVGCSATVEPLDEMAEFLVGRSTPGGEPRECEIVDARFTRDLDVELTCPTDDLVHTPRATVKDRFYSQLHELIQDHTNTIVFTNTRSGAERVLHNLRERYGVGGGGTPGSGAVDGEAVDGEAVDGEAVDGEAVDGEAVDGRAVDGGAVKGGDVDVSGSDRGTEEAPGGSGSDGSRDGGAYDESNSACHHGSLSKDRRQRVERRLKNGDLDVVTTSTSLELGIDMPHVDLVVQVGSPKSVAALLQRIGRAGHQLGQTVTGRVVALDRDELIECAVMLQKATEGFVDRVFVPENASDVAAQHVYGMAIEGPRPEAEIRGILERAYPYRDYGDERWEQLLRYLTADFDGLEDRNVYAKVWRDTNDPPDGQHHYEAYDVGEDLIGKRGRMARVIYMTNLGTIPDSFTVEVYTRGDEEWVGQLDEEYLDTLEAGEVFVLGGERYEYRYRRGSKVYVDPTSARPTVPSWYSERLPLSYDLGRAMLDFQRELLAHYENGGPSEVRIWLREYPLDENSVQAITRTFDEQLRFAGPESVATPDRLVVEVELDHDDYERRYYVHSNYGRRFNDGFSRLLAARVADAVDANVRVAVADNGFTLSLPLNRKVDFEGVLADLDPASVRDVLRDDLRETDLLERYFRINATRALMILKRYKGYEKSASEQQFSSEMLLGFAHDLPDFAVLEETYREILEDKLHVDGIETVVGQIADGDVEVAKIRVDSPSPRAFGLATLVASDTVLAEDESEVLREFHRRVRREIEGEDSPDDPGTATSD